MCIVGRMAKSVQCVVRYAALPPRVVPQFFLAMGFANDTVDLMGLGSMVGTGVFVSIGIAAGVAGPSVLLAIALAALVATCNALSSAQLAASHPVSGGTYEYGYRYLNPRLGLTAGWMFLCAKSASAATAALGFAGYALPMAGGGAAAMPWVAMGSSLADSSLHVGSLANTISGRSFPNQESL